MFPLQDLNPRRRIPFVTIGLIAVNVGVFLWTMLLSAAQVQDIFLRLSVVPANVAENPLAFETILDVSRSMFFHGGWFHLFGNMLYLWLFGDNVEDRMGVVVYLALYIISGFVAATTQILVDPNSTIPLVGASGAIGGVLGSYLLLFPGVRVRGVVFLGRIGTTAQWPAWIVLGLWFALQLAYAVISVGFGTGASGGVAFFAHVGGFLLGIAFTWVFMWLVPQPPAEQRRQVLYERARRYRS